MSLVVRSKPLTALLVIALAAPMFGARTWSTSYADRLAVSIAAGVSALVPWLTPAPGADAASAFAGDGAAALDGLDDDAPLGASLSAAGVSAARNSNRGRLNNVAHGVRVSARQVLALAARRAMPQAVPVKATAQHPAGLMLHGVSALGIGMQDGDVLTEAGGQKATSVATVIGIVLAARGRQVPEINGRFYRGGVAFSLSVEQPYPKEPVPG